MKKAFSVFLISLFALLLCFGCKKHDQPPLVNETDTDVTTANETDTPKQDIETEKDPQKIITNYKDMKAIWLSQFDLVSVYTDGNKQRDKDDYKKLISSVLSNIYNLGFNTVIVQVRPYADSFFPSEIFPPSRYVTADYAYDFEYDPIKILVEEAKKYALSVHAWINPLRCMKIDEIELIDNKYTIKQWYLNDEYNGKFIVKVNDRFYLNPAYSETRKLICDGVDEMIKNYSFDGIHMDDYFYPTTDKSFDFSSYKEYNENENTITLKQFRYNCLNELISSIYSTVKQNDHDILFGISPDANIETTTEKSYADVYTWCENEGYIDYICPQVYYGFEHQTHPFDKIADMWSNIIKTDSVKLVMGLTLGKAYTKIDQWAGSGKNEWKNNTDILKKSLLYTKEINNCKGISIFSYQYFYDAKTNIIVNETLSEVNNLIPILKEISWN